MVHVTSLDESIIYTLHRPIHCIHCILYIYTNALYTPILSAQFVEFDVTEL